MEGYFPSAKAHSSIDEIEEERRLMYVAATRARDHLIMCYPGREELPLWQLADSGYRNGLSSFIHALPGEVMDHVSTNGPGGRTGFIWPLQNFRIHRKSFRSPTPTLPDAPITENIKNTQDGDVSSLRPGDRVRHPAFGRGVISKFMDNTKVEVLFRDVGRKLLHLEHTTLEKM